MIKFLTTCMTVLLLTAGSSMASCPAPDTQKTVAAAAIQAKGGDPAKLGSVPGATTSCMTKGYVPPGGFTNDWYKSDQEGLADVKKKFPYYHVPWFAPWGLWVAPPNVDLDKKPEYCAEEEKLMQEKIDACPNSEGEQREECSKNIEFCKSPPSTCDAQSKYHCPKWLKIEADFQKKAYLSKPKTDIGRQAEELGRAQKEKISAESEVLRSVQHAEMSAMDIPKIELEKAQELQKINDAREAEPLIKAKEEATKAKTEADQALTDAQAALESAQTEVTKATKDAEDSKKAAELFAQKNPNDTENVQKTNEAAQAIQATKTNAESKLDSKKEMLKQRQSEAAAAKTKLEETSTAAAEAEKKYTDQIAAVEKAAQEKIDAINKTIGVSSAAQRDLKDIQKKEETAQKRYDETISGLVTPPASGGTTPQSQDGAGSNQPQETGGASGAGGQE